MPTPVGFCFWIAFTILLILPSVFLGSGNEFSDPTYIPTIIGGIAALVFAMSIFVAEKMSKRRADQVGRALFTHSLIFPLVISTLSSLCILTLWRQEQDYFTLLLPFAVGILAIVSAYRLFSALWEGDIGHINRLHVFEDLRLLFFSEIAKHYFPKSLLLNRGFFSIKNTKKRTDEELGNYVQLFDKTHPSTFDEKEENMRAFGLLLGEFENELRERQHPKAIHSSVPELAYYATSHILNRILPSASFRLVRLAGYQCINIAELAFQLRDTKMAKNSLQLYVDLYWHKEIRDEITEIIWKNMNTFAKYHLEHDLFEKGKNLSEYQYIASFFDIVFLAYQNFILIAYKERDWQNYGDIVSAFLRVLDGFIRGGMSAKRDIEHDAEGAEWYLENQRAELTPEKIQEYEMDIALDGIRHDLWLSKMGLFTGIGAQIFYDVSHERDPETRTKIVKYLDRISQSIPNDLVSLLNILLSIADNSSRSDDRWGWTFWDTPSPTTEEAVTHASVDLSHSVIPSYVMYLILNYADVTPNEYPDGIDVTSKHHLIIPRWIEMLEKINESPDSGWWATLLLEQGYSRIESLKFVLKEMLERAKQEERKEVREAAIHKNADKLFKNAVVTGYKKTARIRKLLKEYGLLVHHRETEQYVGSTDCMGYYQTVPKDLFFEEHSININGEDLGQGMGRTEDKEILSQLQNAVEMQEMTQREFIDHIAEQEGEVLLIVNDSFVLENFLSTENESMIRDMFTPAWQIPKNEIPFETGMGRFDGYLAVNGKRIWVKEAHLVDNMLLIHNGELGSFTFFTPNRDRAPFPDASTRPLKIKIEIFSELPERTEELMLSDSFMPEITSSEEKRNKIQELAGIEIMFRFELSIHAELIEHIKIIEGSA